jgi:hypothetical protein
MPVSSRLAGHLGVVRLTGLAWLRSNGFGLDLRRAFE